MDKGYEGSPAWLFIGVFLFIFGVAVIYAFISFTAEVGSEFPEISGQLNSYKTVHKIMSQECFGLGTYGILAESKFTDIDCADDPSLGIYVKIVAADKEWEFSNFESVDGQFGKPFLDDTFLETYHIIIRMTDGSEVAGTITIATSYLNREILAFLRTCAEEAWDRTDCRRAFIASQDKIVVYEDSKICTNTNTDPDLVNAFKRWKGSPPKSGDLDEIANERITHCVSITGTFSERTVHLYSVGPLVITAEPNEAGLAISLARIDRINDIRMIRDNNTLSLVWNGELFK